MSSESPPAKKPKARTPAIRGREASFEPAPTRVRLLDGALLITFLALTFLLGAFPLKDTDFWWHLRTGDLIRESGKVPTTDIYTFTRENEPWIDLHWLFQVAVSLVYERGGVRALTLAKCAVTTIAVFLLVTARKREWPLWAMLAAWLPALLVLSGRMYVRPETLTLLYLSAFLAVLVRIDRRPYLALILPGVQVAWVNTQGLFVLGPILLGAALLDASLRRGAFATERKRWWQIISLATVFTALACLVNPYGLTGALYPLQLARTMGNPVFSNSIAELTPVLLFIKRDGFNSLPMRLHFLTLILGVLSFLIPIVWLVFTRFKSTDAAVPKAKIKGRKGAAVVIEPRWRLSLFRVLLFSAFSALSFQATRNSHQFAAVVGSITAWNFAEWAAAFARRRGEMTGSGRHGWGVGPRLGALVAIALVFLWVATGQFYQASKEGRTIGLGEQPLWFPHEASRFAGQPGMPGRFLAYHIGHPSLYEYYNGPKRKVFADARLEVMGAELYERYIELGRRIETNANGWTGELDAIGRPAVLVDLENNAGIGATLLASRDWRCVWIDPVAAVFVHVSYDDVIKHHAVDFAGRHFRPEPAFQPHGTAALIASAKGLRNLASPLVKRVQKLVAPIVLLGIDHARRAADADPQSAEAWKYLGQFEFLREPQTETPIPRFRMPFDPVFDLSSVRATYALRRSIDTSADFTALLSLIESFKSRGMTADVIAGYERLLTLTPVNGRQTEMQAEIVPRVAALRATLGPAPPAKWDNLGQLNQIVNELLTAGRVAEAAAYLERAAPGAVRSWEETDRIATFYLHLGLPDKSRKLWESAASPPRPGLRDARLAVAAFASGDFETARRNYHSAIASDPTLFEAYFGLASLERDSGHAGDALSAARKAVTHAPSEFARNTAQGIVAAVTPYANSPIAVEGLK